MWDGPGTLGDGTGRRDSGRETEVAGSSVDDVGAHDDWATRIQREALPALMRAHLRLAAAEGSLELGDGAARAKLREGAASIDAAIGVLRDLVAECAIPVDAVADATEAGWRRSAATSWTRPGRRTIARLVRP
jgi:hypothetical protein